MLSVPVEIQQVQGELSGHVIEVSKHRQVMFALPLQGSVSNQAIPDMLLHGHGSCRLRGSGAMICGEVQGG